MSDEHKSRSWLEKLTALITQEPQNRDQILEILQDAEERHILTGETLGMMERILQVSDIQVREIMIPKSQMMIIDQDTSLEQLLPMVIESGHSRFPVFDENGEDVIGILLAKDLLKYCYDHAKEEFSLQSIIRPPVFTPQSKRLDILLREFRLNRNHIAIVLDEYGYVAGLITIEDVLEQIVGEIEDEYDTEEEDQIKRVNDDTYIVKASTTIDDFNDYFNTNFDDIEFDTIGGIVLKGFGYLPKRGETTTLSNYKFKVLHSDNRRIFLLEVKSKKPTKK